MKKSFSESKVLKILLLTFVLTALLSFGIVQIIAGSNPTPGSNQDPIVTKSYVDMKIAEALAGLATTGSTVSTGSFSLDAQALNDKITELENQLKNFERDYNYSTITVSTEIQKTKFAVVQVFKGQKLLLGEGSEMILRAGTANSISGPGGDMSNLTNGLSVPNNSKMDTNHLIISSRDDGRGLIVISDTAWVLVKGEYKVEK